MQCVIGVRYDFPLASGPRKQLLASLDPPRVRVRDKGISEFLPGPPRRRFGHVGATVLGGEVGT